MEEDRAETNLGALENSESQADVPEVPRVPKKRFVGRKTALEKSGNANDTSNGTIEDSGAIQGNAEYIVC
jgi:2-(3-amino-3-carboxypropyl)histidine synthase